MKDIHKYFGRVHALKGVNFQVSDNEVVGLIGDNGAGKSTLIKILSGIHPCTKGEIVIKGKKIDTGQYSVNKARELGIETVYQEQALGLKQSLWRNIFLGRQPTTSAGFINMGKVYEETSSVMKDFLGFTGGGITPDSKVSNLSGGERQGIAIGRAMYFEADLIILDEPTRALSAKEVNKVLDFIRKVKEQGKSCIYISHTIANIYSVSDRFVLLDRGDVAGSYKREDTTEQELTNEIIRQSTASETIKETGQANTEGEKSYE